MAGSASAEGIARRTTRADVARALGDEVEATFWVRYVLAAALVVAALLAPLDPASQRGVVVAGLVFLPGNAVLHHLSRRADGPIDIVVIWDCLIVGLVGLLAPALCPTALVVLSVALVGAAAYSRLRPLLLGGMLGFALLAGCSASGATTMTAVHFFAAIVATAGSAYVVHRATAGNRARLRYFRTLVHGADAVPVEFETESAGVVDIGDSIESLLGHPAAAFTDVPVFLHGLIAPADLARFQDAVCSARTNQDSVVIFRARDGQGRQRCLRAHLRGLVETDGRRFSRGVLIDATAEAAAQLHNERYGELVDRIPAGVVVLELSEDRQLVVGAVNPAAERVVGVPADGAVGRPLRSILPAIGAEQHDLLVSVARGADPVQFEGVPMPLGLASEENRIDVDIFPLSESSLAIVIEDVTARQQAHEALAHQAMHDELTGLPNRSHIQAVAGELLPHADDPDRPAVLLLADLDDFKVVNDTLGHHLGDQLLCDVADRIWDAVGSDGVAARLGGDEFAVLLHPGTGSDRAWTAARRVAAAIREPLSLEGTVVSAKASIGMALAPLHGQDFDTLLQRADVAMYEAKGTDTDVALYRRAIDQSSLGRLELAGELPYALDRGEMVLRHQPKMRLSDRRIVGSEALVRWDHPTRGLLPPADFLELVRVGGLFARLTREVVDRLIDDIGRLSAERASSCFAFNMSAREFFDRRLVDGLVARLRTVPNASFMVEITEDELMADGPAALGVVKRLADAGVGVSIDDFGTGYSSLAYLSELAAAEVKIDRSLIDGLTSPRRAETVVRAIIELGHELGMTVVAEGVEDAATAARLAELNCDLIQGFWVSRPVDAGDLDGFLAGDGHLVGA